MIYMMLCQNRREREGVGGEERGEKGSRGERRGGEGRGGEKRGREETFKSNVF